MIYPKHAIGVDLDPDFWRNNHSIQKQWVFVKTKACWCLACSLSGQCLHGTAAVGQGYLKPTKHPQIFLSFSNIQEVVFAWCYPLEMLSRQWRRFLQISFTRFHSLKIILWSNSPKKTQLPATKQWEGNVGSATSPCEEDYQRLVPGVGLLLLVFMTYLCSAHRSLGPGS